MAFTETELTDFINNVKQRGRHYSNDTSFNSFLQDTIGFLTGKTTQIIYKPTYYFGYCFEPIYELIPTNTADWQEKHELVLGYSQDTMASYELQLLV